MDIEKLITDLNTARPQTPGKLRGASIAQLQQDRAASLDILVQLNSANPKDNPGLAQAVRFVEDELSAINGELRRKENNFEAESAAARRQFARENGDIETTSAILQPNQSVRSYMRENNLVKQPEFESLTFGAMLRAAVCGPRNELERRALSEGTDSAGGYTVPDVALARFIDKMRAQTVAIRAGAQTVPLTSDRTVIARTASDPAAAWRVENAAVAVADPSYEAVIFTPRSLAVIVKVSRELLEDSLNIERMLEASFAGSMAAELDRVALVGSGIAPEPLGIVDTPNVGSVAAVGTPADYTKFVDGLYELWVDNEQTCSAVVMHPRTLVTISTMPTGIASDKTVLARPPVLEGIPFMQTTSIPITLGAGAESLIVMGNFARLMIGVRTALRVEVLRELYAGNHQYGLCAHLRADVGVEHPESFAVLSGVTNT